ncbi:MAG: radical SAM family heme chaperone HemW [Lachnospiraceae bacterium]|nr:radical SAM family heme chaperone HemW [Lachnospiraceae bacterium]
MMNKDCSIYIHVPFCARKCQYCDFLSVSGEEEAYRPYFEALLKEAGLYSKVLSQKTIQTVYIGGGTPSLVPSVYIKNILCKLKEMAPFETDAEISMEMNPGTFREEATEDYREAGISRVSIGCQSIHAAELEALGRIHDHADFLRTYEGLRRAGFDNLNVDLMTGIPEETVKTAKQTLKAVAGLDPEHISVYSLILEPGTPLYAKAEAGLLRLPAEEECIAIDEMTSAYLDQKGYRRVEISNYAKPGRECRHNVRNWECRDYLGLGAGAASLLDGHRMRNTADIRAYIKDPEHSLAEDHLLTEKEKMEEFMFLGLRMTRGVSLSDFKERFGRDLLGVYGESVRRHCREGLLVFGEDRLFLTERGLAVSNPILADFLL